MSILVDNGQFKLEGDLGFWQGSAVGDLSGGGVQFNVKLPRGMTLKRLWVGGWQDSAGTIAGYVQIRTGICNMISMAKLESLNAITIGASTYRPINRLDDRIDCPPVKYSSASVGGTEAILTVLFATNTNLCNYKPQIVAQFEQYI